MTDAEFKKLLAKAAGPRAKDVDTVVDERYTERDNGRTPNGGDYSIAYYYDKDRRPCVKEEARYINIVEYTSDGNRINETYGVLG